MLKALSTRHNRNRSFVRLAVCGVLAGAAAAVTIIDYNPVGLRGILAFLSASAFVLAFVHPWRAAKQFVHLIYAAGLGLIVFVVLHNVFDAVASTVGGSGLVHGLLDGAAVVCFFGAILLCPAGLLVGAVGALTMFRREGDYLLR